MAGVRIDASDLRKVAKIAKAYGPELQKQLRRQLRVAGKLGADAAKEGIREMPSKGQDDHGLREMIANAITVNIATTARADVRIRVRKTPALVEYGAGGIAKAINKGRWKHPVYAKVGSARYDKKQNWPTQQGFEFFDHRIEPLRPQMTILVKAALDDAARIAAERGTL